MRFRKRPFVVSVRFAVADSPIQTLEGCVMCCAGDAILTGKAGEHWPVARSSFEDDYQPIPPTKMGKAGGYRKRPVTVEARCVKDPEAVRLANADVLSAKPGDWIVTGPNGDEWVVAATIFARTYEAVQPHEA